MDVMTLPWWFFGLAVLVAWVLTGALRRYALARNVIDIPNARSSHKVPTPRGGGIAFVVTYIAGLCALLGTGALALDGVAVLAGGGAWIALIGFLDDHGHIQARWRLLAHFLAAAWVLYWMGGAPPLTLFGVALSTGWVLNAFAVLYLVWLLNLYNFMDGIDGLASIEAMCVAGGGVLLYALVGAPAAAIPSLLLVAAVAGFLIWNFPPAKIFMGDGGSGFLGLVLGALSLQAGWQSPALFWGWLILLGVFIVDATFTLLRRLLRGEKVYEAHRSHAYQFASRKWASHRRVTLAVLAINLLWLLPLAVAAVSGWLDGVVAVVIAYVPLFGLAILLKAGAGEPPSD
ncbi:glycosyl transferase [Achromobacter insolitus]|nr:glycosyl transferase [Achromobacter insolitus]